MVKTAKGETIKKKTPTPGTRSSRTLKSNAELEDGIELSDKNETIDIGKIKRGYNWLRDYYPKAIWLTQEMDSLKHSIAPAWTI